MATQHAPEGGGVAPSCDTQQAIEPAKARVPPLHGHPLHRQTLDSSLAIVLVCRAGQNAHIVASACESVGFLQDASCYLDVLGYHEDFCFRVGHGPIACVQSGPATG